MERASFYSKMSASTYNTTWYHNTEEDNLSKAVKKTPEKKLCGLSLQANYTDQAKAACRRSWCQLLRIEGATWSA
jgi:hypothetical protein